MISLNELYRRHGIEKSKANRLIELGKIEVVSRSTERPFYTYLSEKSVEAFIEEKAGFESTYILCKDVFKSLGLSDLSFYKYLKNNKELNKLFTQENDFFKIHELQENYYGISTQRFFFKQDDWNNLQQHYITIPQAQYLVGQKDNSGFSSWLERRPTLQIFCFSKKNRRAKFLKKSLLLRTLKTFKVKISGPQYDKNRYMSFKDTRLILKLSETYFDKLLQEKTLVPAKNIGRALFFDIELVQNLITLQKREYHRLSEDYMTLPQILLEFPNLNSNNLPTTKKIRKIDLPVLLSTIFKKENDQFALGKYLYLKDDVRKYHEFFSAKSAIQSEAIHTDPFSEYTRRLEIKKITFTSQCIVTQVLWNEYAAEFLRSRQGRAYNVIGEIWCLVRVAEALTHLLDKEIFKFSAKELNLILLNNNRIGRRAREEIYQFLLFVHKVLMLKQSKSPFKPEALINPRKLHRKKREKKIYNFFEYESFFKYVTNLNIHKRLATTAAVKLIEKSNTKQYHGYDSIWLYMLIHLNNAWRHSDCQNIPRISLEGTEIKSLQWLLDNELSDGDVKKIIFRLKCSSMIVSKTHMDRNFFCASEVERPLATAVAICELRTAICNEHSQTIISGICNKNGKMLKHKSLISFFQNYCDKDSFSFSNRAMNRTVISLVQCVQAFYGATNDTEYLRILRSHVDIESTDIYNQIPQERMDIIALQLFDRDMFGHVPDVISKLLFGQPHSESLQTIRIREIKEKVGDIYKLEEMASFLNNIHDFNIQASRGFIEENTEYKDIVEKIIKEMSHDELQSMYQKILTRQLPGKEEHYQCLVSESLCKFPGRNCGECPLSIPHFYAISSLIERIFKKIQSIKISMSEQLPEAELTRMANWLQLDLELLVYTQVKYGKEEVAMFATGLNKQLQEIGYLYAYQTIKTNEVNI
ncbi:hypothetical protein OM416_13665 [Paenibacillus sp. LS1]|uniref:hypothetical protein n=1 Tax=Paenibacillus sp. LS1 TaxID=2992120 RepID=UPI00222FD045|nr:hypothetical protein [Paenibacillus sp. LS1]MCW3792637.1 hypothetical protein [Paenibacillus sp. LS1]